MSISIKLFVFYGLIFMQPVALGAEPPPSLKEVMNQLQENQNKLNRAILLEDYSAIEKAASKIASHPKPTNDLPFVVKTLGPKIKEFKGYDLIVHNSAADIAKLAKKKDLDTILAKNSEIMKNCVGCHTKFRLVVSAALSKRE